MINYVIIFTINLYITNKKNFMPEARPNVPETESRQMLAKPEFQTKILLNPG